MGVNPLFFGIAALDMEGVEPRPAVGLNVQAGLCGLTLPGASPLHAALFYPSASPERPIGIGRFSLSVAMNGTPTDATKGLIILSHGLSGSEVVHHNLGEYLARQGYLVVAPLHAGDNWYDRSLINSTNFFLERSIQLSRVLDGVLAHPEWGERVPNGKIGAIGFSMGANSVLVLLGAKIDTGKAIEYLGKVKGPFKPMLEAALKGMLLEPKIISSNICDGRVRAAVIMAPFCSLLNTSSVRQINIPIKTYTAEHDDNGLNGDWLREQLPASEFEMIKGAGHFVFTAQRRRSPKELGADIPLTTGDAISDFLMNLDADQHNFDRSAFHKYLEEDAARFFGMTLQDKAEI